MKIQELIKQQDAMLEALRKRGMDGDNEAARVYLEALDRMSQRIDEWKKSVGPHHPQRPQQ